MNTDYGKCVELNSCNSPAGFGAATTTWNTTVHRPSDQTSEYKTAFPILMLSSVSRQAKIINDKHQKILGGVL